MHQARGWGWVTTNQHPRISAHDEHGTRRVCVCVCVGGHAAEQYVCNRQNQAQIEVTGEAASEVSRGEIPGDIARFGWNRGKSCPAG